jgi:hypothetical protein
LAKKFSVFLRRKISKKQHKELKPPLKVDIVEGKKAKKKNLIQKTKKSMLKGGLSKPNLTF